MGTLDYCKRLERLDLQALRLELRHWLLDLLTLRGREDRDYADAQALCVQDELRRRERAGTLGQLTVTEICKAEQAAAQALRRGRNPDEVAPCRQTTK